MKRCEGGILGWNKQISHSVRNEGGVRKVGGLLKSIARSMEMIIPFITQ
jgi:hypothetical protein